MSHLKLQLNKHQFFQNKNTNSIIYGYDYYDANRHLFEICKKLINISNKNKKLGKTMWDNVGMARNAEGLKKAAAEIREIREEFWKEVEREAAKLEVPVDYYLAEFY